MLWTLDLSMMSFCVPDVVNMLEKLKNKLLLIDPLLKLAEIVSENLVLIIL